MNEREFYYWLRGFFELSGAEFLNKQQVQIVKEHMDLVVKKETKTTMFGNPEKVNQDLIVSAQTIMTC